jgi:hypothetical protein
MGGEYLPDRRDRPGSSYWAVDEYDGDALTAKRTRSSRRALSRGEQVALFLRCVVVEGGA